MTRRSSRWLLPTAALIALQALFFPQVAESKAILGVDLGSLYMKVALVQRGAPLEIVTNLHSKRKTENMILFDSGTRFYGADASSLLARKPQKTPTQMSIMLGRDADHPAVKVLSDRHFPIVPQFNESRHGVNLEVSGDSYTPEELVAMVLGHAKEFTQTFAGEQGGVALAPKDVVLTVPSFATVHERRALIDAAQLADLNVLGLLEENTASALNFAMDKQYPEPKVLLFYNMGASAVQVSIIRFFSYARKESGSKEKTVGALEVLAKAWDSTLGGQEFDHRIVEHLADKFNENWDKKRGDKKKKDVRTIPRAMTKLRIQANKVKHVLSANSEFPIYMESLYDDTPLSVHLTRATFEELSHDLLDRAVKPVHEALKIANLTLEDLDGIEMIGGGMRIPKIQNDLSKALGDIELGMHINSDESMALGAAFHGANISTAFRVRHVGLADINPFPIAISLEDLGEEDSKKKKKKGEEPWTKQATIFKAYGKHGVKKTIAFTHDKDVHCELSYDESEVLPEGTENAIVSYRITGISDFAKEMEEKELGTPKVSLQFQLDTSGITNLVKAEAAVEELYMAEEEVEVDDDEEEEEEEEAEEAVAEETEASEDTETEKEDSEAESKEDSKTDDEKSDEAGKATDEDSSKKDEKKDKKKKKKKKKTIIVEKEKKRVHKKSLAVETYYKGKVQSLSAELLEESKAKLEDLDQKDKERAMLEAARNKLESYIYHIKNKLIDDEENINKVSTEEQREEIRKLAEDAEEWMYDDGSSADLATTEDKYAELATPAEKIFFRVTERTTRPEAVLALQSKLTKVEELMKKWETTMPQVTEEERGDVLEKVGKIREWITEQEEAQSKLEAHEEPAFTSTEVPKQTKSLEVLVSKLKKKPKPKPPKKEETEANATDESEENVSEEDAKESDETKEESKDDSEAKDEEADGEDEEDGDKRTNDEL